MAEEDEGRGQAALVRVEVVLGDPHRLEAELLGVTRLLGGETVPVGRVRPLEQPREESDLYNRHR
jgi:hypothetical protein